MPNKLPPLLVTSCVYVSAPFVGLSNAESRIELTLAAIERWLQTEKSLKIVICDGSGYDFARDVFERFPEAAIECVAFKNNTDLVADYGKGFGEGEIVEYALEHSRHLSQSEHFAKCTSKLWVTNFTAILKTWNDVFQCDVGFDNVTSIVSIRPLEVDTRFYIVRKDFYIDTFKDAHKSVRDREGYYLEHSFRDAMLNRRLQFSRYLFPVPALIEGVSGSSGASFAVRHFSRGHHVRRYIKRVILKINEQLVKPFSHL
jgi:hypothetical protein